MFSSSNTVPWTRDIRNYTANSNIQTVVFGFDADPKGYVLLDNVSLIAVSNPSIEILDNPSFDDSISNPIAWSIWCSATCATNSGGNVTNTGCLSTTCYKGSCNGAGGKTDYITQSFSATVGQIYTLSFWYQGVRTAGGPGATIFYVAIV